MVRGGGRLLKSELLRSRSRDWSGAGGKRTDGGIEVIDGKERDVPVFGVDVARSTLVERDPEKDARR